MLCLNVCKELSVQLRFTFSNERRRTLIHGSAPEWPLPTKPRAAEEHVELDLQNPVVSLYVRRHWTQTARMRWPSGNVI